MSLRARPLRRWRAGRSSRALLLALGLGGCASYPTLEPARRGAIDVLRTRIDAEERAASLHADELEALARITAAREVATAPPGPLAVARIRDVRACALEVSSALGERAKTKDAAGAAAAEALFDAGVFGRGDVRGYASAPDDAWRALGVRALTGKDDGPARKRALSDPSPAVRRAALRATERAKDPSDLDAVLEAARLDPDPMVRTEAVRLVVSLAREGEPQRAKATVDALRDLYAKADDAIREDIGAAWASPGMFDQGGREALRVLLASEVGPGPLAAASALLREPRTRGLDAELASSARAALGRAIAQGTVRDRLHALAVAPLTSDPPSPTLLESVRKAADDPDVDVSLSALGRLVSGEAPKATRDDARRKLEGLARPQADGDLYPGIAGRARVLLAHAGDAGVQGWLEADLVAADAGTRMTAVDGLVALGRATRAAPALADRDPEVRARGACALLVASRVGAPLR